ncbi:hypothetical protein ACTHGU_08825 [Chitinophagaceae bacterium MMS25-I14]
MKQIKSILMLSAGIALFASCKKNDSSSISTPPLQIGATVDDSKPLCGAIKGTMLAGKTYTIGCDVTVAQGDTLLLQEGVHVNVTGNYSISVKGTLISLGTKDKPNWFTVPNMVKTDVANLDPNNDQAFSGKWLGIAADTSCNLLVLKWTHLEYGGGLWQTPTVAGVKSGDKSRLVMFQNPNGNLIIEDSWLYGCVDDAVRISSGKFSIMRNTVEKCGYQGGDVFNAKSGSVGDMAYNLFVGTATTGTKASNKGGIGPQTHINMYNNTYINGGWRQIQTGRGGDVNYEEGSYGTAYNNLMVNCKFGLRIVNNPAADTAKMHYGNSFNYGDSANIVNQFYPQGYITIPQSTDIPAPATFLPSGYVLGAVYTAPQLVGQNNPQFVNFTLPNAASVGVNGIAHTSGLDFHLKSSSPCIGKGYTGFAPIAAVPVDAHFGATEITAPGKDIGCYQADGSGNKH